MVRLKDHTPNFIGLTQKGKAFDRYSHLFQRNFDDSSGTNTHAS